jgi:Cysteine-rich secretory protein family
MAFPDLPQTEAAIIEMTNTFRAEQQLAAVKLNPTLAKAAKAFADYLARTNQFGHTVDGRQPADRTGAQGYKHCIVAENLALNQDSRGFDPRGLANQAVTGWKNSPPHRAAMLNGQVTEIGIGIARSLDPVPKYLSVQLFGRPETFKFAFKIENRSGAAVTYQFDKTRHALVHNSTVTQTTCTPGVLQFEGVVATYSAVDGTVYRLTRGVSGALHVDVAREPAKPPAR